MKIDVRKHSYKEKFLPWRFFIVDKKRYWNVEDKKFNWNSIQQMRSSIFYFRIHYNFIAFISWNEKIKFPAMSLQLWMNYMPRIFLNNQDDRNPIKLMNNKIHFDEMMDFRYYFLFNIISNFNSSLTWSKLKFDDYLNKLII